MEKNPSRKSIISCFRFFCLSFHPSPPKMKSFHYHHRQHNNKQQCKIPSYGTSFFSFLQKQKFLKFLLVLFFSYLLLYIFIDVLLHTPLLLSKQNKYKIIIHPICFCCFPWHTIGACRKIILKLIRKKKSTVLLCAIESKNLLQIGEKKCNVSLTKFFCVIFF